MRMSGWALFFCAVGLAVAIALLVDERRRQHELLYMERMRNSMLYFDLYPLVVFARKHEIDRVLIERNRIVFYSVCPPGSLGAFILSEHGYRPLNALRTRALAQVLAEDIPVLQENRHYRLRRYFVMRPNGHKDPAYQFTIRSSYKTELMYARQRIWLD